LIATLNGLLGVKLEREDKISQGRTSKMFDPGCAGSV